MLIYPVLQSYNYHCGSYLEKDLSGLRKYVSYYVAGDQSLFHKAGDPDLFQDIPAYWSAVVDNSVTSTSPDLQVNKSLVSSPDNLNNAYCFPLLDNDPSGLPPTYVLALTRDAIRDDAAHYAHWLEYCGVRVQFVEESHATHSFMFLYSTDDCALQHLRRIAKFIWQELEP